MNADESGSEQLRTAWRAVFVRGLLERLAIALERIADALEEKGR